MNTELPQTQIRRRIKALVEQTNEAFACCGGLNMDYAAFAALSLTEFKAALNNPDLTDRDLRKIIRSGHNTHKAKNPKGCWATFVAGHIANCSNQNLAESLTYGLDKVYEEKP